MARRSGGINAQARKLRLIEDHISAVYNLLRLGVVTPHTLVSFREPEVDALLGVDVQRGALVPADMDVGATAEDAKLSEVRLEASESLERRLAIESGGGGGVKDMNEVSSRLRPVRGREVCMDSSIVLLRRSAMPFC